MFSILREAGAMKISSRIKDINKLNLIIAIGVAIAAWIYVVFNVNPTMNRTFHSLPIKVMNQDVLADNNLAISSMDLEEIDVTLRARRSVLDSINDDSIIVSADVSDLGNGENKIALTVTTSKDAAISKQSASTVVVKVEPLKKKTVSVKSQIYNSVNESDEFEITEIDNEKVEVSGAKSLIDHVSYAAASLDASKIGSSEKTYRVRLDAKNSHGKSVKYIMCHPEKVNVKALKTTKKKVKLNVAVKNPSDDTVERSFEAPKEIYIKGEKSKLEKITSISTNTIDISDVKQSSDIKMTYDLPEGVSIANESMDAKLHVVCNPLDTKSFTISSDSINITNVAANYNKEASGEVKIILYGTKDELSKINSEDISLSVDLSGYGGGTHEITPSVSSAGGARRAEISGKITITLN